MDNDIERTLIANQLAVENSSIFLKTRECVMKSVKYSCEFKDKGNKLYYKCTNDYEKLEESFKMYIKSIAFAPCNSNTLAFAFGNRSAVLQRMNKYKESILDIDRALKITKDEKFKAKLLSRRGECIAKIKNVSSMLNYQDSSKIKTPDLILPDVILSNKEAEICCDSIDVQFDTKFNRYLIATQDIKPGEIILMEKPYVSSLNLNYSHIYCSHCFKKSWATIPCDFCNWCMFCSEECKKLAWKSYHDVECITVSYLIEHYEIDYFDHLSLKSLLMGIRESGSIENFKIAIQSLDKHKDQYEIKNIKNEIFLSSKFKSVYTLDGELPTEILRSYASKCAKILIILFKYTQLFEQTFTSENSKDLLKNKNILFIGSVLLKLKKKLSKKIHIIPDEKYFCTKFNNSVTYKINNSYSKGAYVAPITSFIKQSCNPNTKQCLIREKLIVFSLQPIKKNTPLYISYQPSFFELEKPVRQRLITQNMNFNCECEACENNWPTITEIYKMPKENPFLYAKTYQQKESDLFDENNKLVSSIMFNHGKVQFNKKIIRQLQKAMEKAFKYLDQPSIVICELMICLGIVFEKIYNLDPS